MYTVPWVHWNVKCFISSCVSSITGLSLKVTTTVNIGVPIVVTLLDTQDVLTINNYYADGIGLIDSNAIFTYQLEDLSALPVTIPIPETATITTIQKITAFTVAN